ncbi:MAG: cupredoxin domain-containing protein [Candidatus Kaiserbacteria bacterium]|nr:cupredoxin domain-containing protein [Candidatus Kaiserbacteria bacterium]
MKGILIAIAVSVVLIGGAAMLSNGNGNAPVAQVVKENNVSIVDGTQIVEIDAKGGYLPRKSVAKAGVPTIIRFNTVATFDCSSSVRIPSMDISKILPQTGSTDIDVGVQGVGPLEGSCGMGMYPFEIVFE